MIEVVLFDIDGTLINSAEAAWRWYSHINSRFGGPEITFEKYKKHFFNTTLRDIIKYFFPDSGEEQINKICEYAIDVAPEFHKYVNINKNVLEVLQELKGRYRLGIVTSRVEVKILKDLGIESFFEHIITIKDYTKPKPHPEPILVALNRFGVKPEEAIFVGDQWNDRESGRCSGVKTVMLNNDTMGDYNIGDFTELLDILNSFESTTINFL